MRGGGIVEGEASLGTRCRAHLVWTLLAALSSACQCGPSVPVSSGFSNGRKISDAGVGVDAGAPCGLRTCATAGANCGPIGDGCEEVLHCGNCQAPDRCGGGGVPSVCGQPACTPRTCAQADAGCGQVSDGCGNLLQCGSCPASIVCGGFAPYACAFPADAGPVDAGSGSDASVACGEFCATPPVCPDGGTTVSGTVYAPTNPDAGYGSPDPLPNAIVYVPGSAVLPFDAGVACDMCGAPVSGDPVALTQSGPDGTFVLPNVPVGSDIPLVIQLGRWRRQVTIPTVAACANTALPPELTRLPRNRSEGDIPLTAMVTGAVDTIECVLRKIGIDDAELTTPSAGGRVQLYVGGSEAVGFGASDSTGTAPPESALTSSPTALAQYDLAIFACVGVPVDQSPGDQANVMDFAAAGGRVYATHYSYVWLYDDPPFSTTADWAPSNSEINGTSEVAVDSAFPKGALLAQWLQLVGASTTLGQVPLNNLRNDLLSVLPPSQNWLSYDDGLGDDWPVHYTFNVPVNAFEGSQCGRVVFSDFHVENAAVDAGTLFPAECTVAPLTPQEKVLEFMLFDLASCVEQLPQGPPICTPLTCALQGFSCGTQGDGCGGTLECGTCATGFCGGGGVIGQCSTPMCTPQTCAQQGAECGPMADGCGGLLQCGSCDAGNCGGGGTANQCGAATFH